MTAEPGRWRIHHIEATGSTNEDLVAQATRGAPDGTVLVTDVQQAGRGRLGRTWSAPAGSSLLFSILLRPIEVPVSRRGWIGALMGLAVTRALARVCGVTARLKWPNDVLIDGRKVAGILAEMNGDALIVGVGLNIDVDATELPRADATSLMLCGVPAVDRDRDAVLAAILDELDWVLDPWLRAEGDVETSGLRRGYLAHSATVGSAVVVHLPDGTNVAGMAVDVAVDGALVVADDRGRTRKFSAGDVRHLRAAAVNPNC